MKGAVLTRVFFFPKMRPQTFFASPLRTSLSSCVFTETLPELRMGLAGSITPLPGKFTAGTTLCCRRRRSDAPWHTEGRGSSSRPGFPSGIIARGLRRCSHSRAGWLPSPFPLGIPGLTLRARDCETWQGTLLGIRAGCCWG